MNLQQLRFLRETVRSGHNLTKAAASLGTSQPALSRAILELEAELGVSIFHRHGKRIVGLSEPGRRVLELSERILADVAGIEQVTAEFLSRDSGHLRIATTHTQARYILPPVVARFRQQYPGVRLTLLQGSPRQIVRLLVDREVDLTIATEVFDDANELQVVPALEWQHVVLVPKGHSMLDGMLTLPALAAHPLVTYVEEFAGRRRIDLAFAADGLRPDVVLEATDSDVIKTYVELGLGVGIVAEMAVDPRRDSSLVALPAGALFGMNLTRIAVRRDAFLRGFAHAFIEMLAPSVTLRPVDGAISAGLAR
ncbi:MAG: CysB family HTH-type transcriptional regulator [Burkholderiaceae bacterium]